MKDVRLLLTLIITWMITQVVVAFVPSPSNNCNSIAASSSSISSKLNFGFNGLGTPNDEKKTNKTKDSSTATTTTTQNEEKKITTKGLFQLIAAGMGAPFLGDYEGVDNVSYNIYTIVTRDEYIYFQFFFRLLSLTYIPLNIYYSS